MSDNRPDDLHPGLGRLLRRLSQSPDTAPDDSTWHALLAEISQWYAEADADRYILERSLELSSREMTALYDQIREQASTDPLTGLVNRASLLDHLHRLLTAGADDPRHLALLYLDLDGFKLVNDRLGHHAGDELLRITAQRIRECVREGDIVARIGGDEFVVVCLDTPAPSGIAEQIARRIVESVRRPYRIVGQQVGVSASVGVAVASTADGVLPDAVINDADLAMYAAKMRGRDRVVTYEPGLGDSRADDLLAAELSAAVDDDELVLHYQPVACLAHGRTIGVEALVRWRRDGHGLVLPAGFIPVAERTGLISKVTRWVLRRACGDAATWSVPVPVSVNLTTIDLQSDDLADVIRDALAVGLPPSRLVLEVTEGAVAAGDGALVDTLEALRRSGHLVALDDFGTGYSSLARLRDLPVDALKIDRSFVKDIDTDPAARSVVGAIVSMLRSLDLTIVAEGIERQTQYDVLVDVACPLGQGFLLGRPGPVPDLTDAGCAECWTPPGPEWVPAPRRPGTPGRIATGAGLTTTSSAGR